MIWQVGCNEVVCGGQAQRCGPGVDAACQRCHMEHKGSPCLQSKFEPGAGMGCRHDKTEMRDVLIVCKRLDGNGKCGLGRWDERE